MFLGERDEADQIALPKKKQKTKKIKPCLITISTKKKIIIKFTIITLPQN